MLFHRKTAVCLKYFGQDCNLLGNLLTVKWILRAVSGNKKGKGVLRAGSGKEWDF